MVIHTRINQSGGQIQLTLQPLFKGVPSAQQDAIDKQLIAAFGDPQINIGGTFTDPNDSTFAIKFPTTENYVGLTTELSSIAVQFYMALPDALPGLAAPTQGEFDAVTPDPSRAATLWQSLVAVQIQNAMAALRSKIVLAPIADVTV